MKNILCPIDFSENAWNAVFTGTKLFAEQECKFYLLHVHEPKMRNISGQKSSARAGMVYQSMATAVENELHKAKAYMEEHNSNPKHHFKTISIEGDLPHTVRELIPKYDIDTIVMGTQGATGAKEVFLGSNTVKVLKHIKDCAMLVVPQSFDFQNLKSVVFPTDFTHFFPKGALEYLLKLFELWNPQVKIFHVAQEFIMSENQQENKEILKKRFEEFSVSFHRVVIETTVTEAIITFAKDQNADLIVLTKYSHDFFGKLTQEPVVKKVSFKTDVPLLVLPNFGED